MTERGNAKGRSPMSIAPSGRLDAAAVPSLEGQLAAALRSGVQRLIVDLSEVTYVSSSALRCLLVAHREMRRRAGSLELVQVRPRIMHTLELCGFDQILSCEPATLS